MCCPAGHAWHLVVPLAAKRGKNSKEPKASEQRSTGSQCMGFLLGCREPPNRAEVAVVGAIYVTHIREAERALEGPGGARRALQRAERRFSEFACWAHGARIAARLLLVLVRRARPAMQL